jgi:hypothetical protein
MIVDIPVNLIAGHDYALVVETQLNRVPVTLKDPSGAVVVTTLGFPDPNGEEFRAQYSATYFIEYDDAVPTLAQIVSDCHGGIDTLCHLAVNHTKARNFEWRRDIDAYRVYLNRAYTYTFSLDRPGYESECETDLNIMDTSGVILKNSPFDYNGTCLHTLTFHPLRTGTYYFQALAVPDDEGFDYTLTLRARR